MKSTFRTIGMASLLLTGVAATAFAAGNGAQPSQSVTEPQTGSQQLSTPPARGRAPNGSYGMNTSRGVNDPTQGGTAGRISPDATHPTVQSPSGGGGEAGSGGGTSR